MFLPCRPCCGEPVFDPCLASCRPPGETRSLSSINLTLSAEDYYLSVDTTYLSPSVSYKTNYFFPGSVYNGTFSLTRTVADPSVFEYVFSTCASCTAYLRYYTGRTFNNCRLDAVFAGLWEPNYPAGNPSNGDDTAPSCASSMGVRVYQSTTDLPITSCGSMSSVVAEGDAVAATFISGFGYFLLGRTLAQAIVETMQIPNTTPGSSLLVSRCDTAVDGFSDTELVFSQFGTGPTPDTATISESGNPTVTLTSVTTSYA